MKTDDIVLTRIPQADGGANQRAFDMVASIAAGVQAG
jgi:hypothetical protein